MKVKTSITLSAETLHAISEIAGTSVSRSQIIEQALVEFIQRRKRALRDARDLEILNSKAEELNQEVEEVLAFQSEL